MVPITEKGRLSAAHFLDGPEKVRELHTRHAEYMRELGLERGRLGSRATHQRVKQFYASVDRDPELKVEPDRIPDPGRLKVLTAEGARAYKLEVLRHVLEQIKEPIQVLQDQSQLTRDERAHRVEAEKRAAEAERQAAERIAAAEREAEEVMRRLDYHGKLHQGALVYRSEDGGVAMLIQQQKARPPVRAHL